MAAEKEMSKECGCAKSGHVCNGFCGNQHWGHLAIKISIVIFVFLAGVEFGEMKAMIRSDYGQQGMMRTYGNAEFAPEYTQYHPAMMVSAPTMPTPPATTTRAK